MVTLIADEKLNIISDLYIKTNSIVQSIKHNNYYTYSNLKMTQYCLL